MYLYLQFAYMAHFELLELKIDSGLCKCRCPETIHKAKGNGWQQSGKNNTPELGKTLQAFSPGRGITIWLINYERTLN